MAPKEYNGREAPQGKEEPALKGNEKKVHWDDSAMRSVSPNAFEFNFSQDEITLLLGRERDEYADRNTLMLQAVSRIVMNPFTAKRLADALNRLILEYETRYGSSGLYSHPPEEPSPLSSSYKTAVSPGLPESGEKSDLVFQLVKSLDVETGFERSFKMAEGSLLGNRFLLGTSKGAIGEHPNERVLYICERMGMPGNLLEDFENNLSDANYVHFGFEENEQSCMYKVYLEFYEKIGREIKNRPDQPGPFLLHLGYKWDVSDYSRYALTRYTWYPALSVEEIMERLSTALEPHRYGRPFDIASGILRLAGQRISSQDILYLEVTEEDNPRRSFDINMYKAGIELEELYPLLSKMRQYYSIPSEAFQEVYESAKAETFGHLSGGIDRNGKDFLTVYFGVRGTRDYKARFSSLSDELTHAPGARQSPHIPKGPFPLEVERKDEKAGWLLQQVKGLRANIGFERSFKVFENTLLADRFLLGVKRRSIPQDPHERIVHVCRQIDMPKDFLEAFTEELPLANIVLFGFERNEDRCLYKSYLEFADRIEEAVKMSPDKPEPFVMHRGFKWDASDNSRKTVTRYTCFSLFTLESIMERITSIFSGDAHKGAQEIVGDILDMAANRIKPIEFLYLEAEEEDSPRISFDVNIYKANLRLKEFYPFLMRMVRYYAIPYEHFRSLYETVKTRKFGHLAGGLDREGRGFLTVYFGETERP
jgi:hypothetical protein